MALLSFLKERKIISPIGREDVSAPPTLKKKKKKSFVEEVMEELQKLTAGRVVAERKFVRPITERQLPSVERPVLRAVRNLPTSVQKVVGVGAEPVGVPEDYLERIQRVFAREAPGVSPEEYYPVYQHIPRFIEEEERLGKPGLAALLALQALYESTGGRLSSNIFGALPGGVGSGRVPEFPSIEAALQYQLGPSVLGGGATPRMNILGEKGPLTPARVVELYRSYDPPQAYSQGLLDYYQQITGFR